ncbi:MAG: bifunctional oligoribonuclease/PAP phosphatase NrnA [bacterium]|nr:bifunctional oligoribonuclease/PAP phosphatase NrnA [bacterium]
MDNKFTEVQDKIIQILQEKNSFLILSHIYPDGDSLGSALGLGLFLSDVLKKQVDVGIDGAVPRQYQFLPGQHLLKLQDNLNAVYEATVVLECPDKSRCGTVANKVKQPGVTINIDHHETNLNFAEFNYVDVSASAVGEQIYQFLIKIGSQKIPKEVAVCLYTAIVTDTGRFSYSNTTPQALTIAAELIATGVDPLIVSQSVYERRSLALTRLLNKMLETITMVEGSPVAYGYISQPMLQETGASPRETEGFIDFIRALENIEVAMLFQDPGNGKIKVSFRSKGTVDVAALAAEVAGGGGHKAAAGCTIEGQLEPVIQQVITFIQQTTLPLKH